MNRHYSGNQFLNSVRLIKKYFPLAAITTDVIVGFPTESEEDFMQTYKLCSEAEFSALHIFQYSARKGTVAEKLYKDLNGKIKQERFEKLASLNKVLKNKFIKKNKFEQVLFEELDKGLYVGYTKNYIRCYVRSKEDLTGKIYNVKIKRPYLEGVKVKLLNFIK